MVSSDIVDILYSTLIIICSLTAIVLLILSITAIFYLPKAKDKSGRFLMYGYVVISIDIFLIELTYLIPSCFPQIINHIGFCISLGAIGHFAQNMTRFFVIGMSMYLLLSVWPSYKKCQCRNVGNIGRAVFLFWVLAGAGYSLFFMIFGLCEKVFGVDRNRCWIVNGPGDMGYFQYQWISYRTLRVVVVIITIVYSILCSYQFKKRVKMYKGAFETSHFRDTSEKNNIVESLNNLDRALMRQYIALTIVCVFQEVVSDISYIIPDNWMSKSQKRAWFGWTDIVYVITYFFTVTVFTETSLERFISHIWNKYITPRYRNNISNNKSSDACLDGSKEGVKNQKLLIINAF